MNKKLLIQIFSVVLLLVSMINLNFLGFQNAAALTEPNDETDIPASCSDKFIRMMDVFEAEFYNEMDKIVHSGKLESQVSTEYMDAYQNTRRRFNELTNKVIADLIGVDLAQGTNLVQSCLGIKQEYLQRVEFGFKAVRQRSMEAKKGAIFLEKYDKINTRLEELVSVASDARDMLNKLNDNFTCYTQECAQ